MQVRIVTVTSDSASNDPYNPSNNNDNNNGYFSAPPTAPLPLDLSRAEDLYRQATSILSSISKVTTAPDSVPLLPLYPYSLK